MQPPVLATALGLLGLLMRTAGVPVAPAVVGLILGPLAEQQLRRALTLSEGDPSILLSSPITVFLWIVVVLSLLIPLLLPVAKRRRRALTGP
jgi:putative tricarboxylic transport membrane protein